MTGNTRPTRASRAIRVLFMVITIVAGLAVAAVVWSRFVCTVAAESMGKEQTRYLGMLAESKFSGAYATLANWQHNPYLQHSVFPGLVSFWREVGTATTTPTLNLRPSATLPDHMLLKSLRFALWNDAHTSESFRGQNYFPVFDTVFKDKKSWASAYAELAVGMARKSSSVSQAMLKTVYENCPEPVLQSLDPATSAAMLFAAGKYQAVITLRETILPDVSSRGTWDQFILWLEVYAYGKSGREAKARELEAEYRRAGVLSSSPGDFTGPAEE